jgi:choline-sulfatase
LSSDRKPNVLFVMTDQQRADTIAALGNRHIWTPNLDRLAARGVAFTNAYTTCAVCVAARYTIRTGCEPPTTRVFSNRMSRPAGGQPEGMEARSGPYLARTMRALGYRTFGIGKFHSNPTYEDLGYETHLHAEELYGSPEGRRRDAYASWLAREHPEFDFVETLMGERTEMYYMPQASPTPAGCGVESWAADRAVEAIRASSDGSDGRPFFGLVSFIGPHPPFAPPVPFNRMYDPDRMPNPIVGPPSSDHRDPFVPWSNHTMYADEISPHRARCLRARYYGEISYIDTCLGRILDAVDALPDAENTLVAFFADHGDHLGDHNAWQKETFFDSCAKVPLLASWPARLAAGERRRELVCLADLFGLATGAAGAPQLREGADVLGMLEGEAPPRETLVGMYGEPGSVHFKIMVRRGPWKYEFIANGAGELLFNLDDDPHELLDLSAVEAGVKAELRALAETACDRPGAREALDGSDGGGLRAFPLQAYPPSRCLQFDGSRGVRGFPARPEDALAEYRRAKGGG